MEEYKIDLVVPYVNNNDKVWQEEFSKLCCKYSCYTKYMSTMRGNRYDDEGLFELNLKLIMKNMPWINNIYLLVSNKEQVPHYARKILGNKLKVVLHQDFIYGQYLPTFNSTTIEMFLWNIRGLEEHFIYINDDMYPINSLKPSNFFHRQNNEDYLRLTFLEEAKNEKSTQFKKVCHNCYKKVLERIEGKNYKDDYFIRPLHSFTPMLKSHCRKCFKLLENDIKRHIGRFRNENQYNQYIYPLYEKLKYGTLNANYKFKYLELGYDKELIENEIKNNDIVCINDNGKDKVDIILIKKMLSEVLNDSLSKD